MVVDRTCVIEVFGYSFSVPKSFKLGSEFQIPNSSKIDCSLKLGCSIGGAVRDFGVVNFKIQEFKKYFQEIFSDSVQYSGVV